MGFYINPQDQSKEEWLEDHAVPFDHTHIESRKDFSYFIKRGQVPLVHVDNGPFTALAIAFDYGELQVFANDRSGRPVHYYLAPIKDVIAVVPSVAPMLEPTANDHE